MITGFNTDIDYDGVTYHVQTEDKGLDTPLILSLVYNGGTILASKRSPYNDLLLGDFNEKELAERLQRQHKLICAAIRAGRIEDLKKMNGKLANAVKASTPIPPLVEPVTTIDAGDHQKVELPDMSDELPSPLLLNDHSKDFEPIKKPQIALPEPVQNINSEPIITNEATFFAPIEITDADLIFEDSQKLEDFVMVPDDAVEIITGFSQTTEPPVNKVIIEMLTDAVFKGGDSRTVSLLVRREMQEGALPGVGLMIKVLGSSFRPLIFHTKTDSNGVATVHLQIPQFTRGRAAILIKAMVNHETAELRRIILAN